MPRPRLLHVDHLGVQRGPAELLKDISWSVHRGEHWVVLGANGSGKTTLLKVLMGFLTASRGHLEVLGQIHGTTDWRDLRRQLGLVSSALHAHIPAAEPALETVISGRYAQLDFWSEATATDRREARRALRVVGAPDALASRPWAWLSQGERQRVLIARALVARPRLLILDEPCAGLDPVARASFLATVEQLAGSPRAPGLFLVTHHVEEITPSFSHVLLLAGGRVSAAGPRDEVLTSAQLSTAFGQPLTLRRSAAGYRLDVKKPAQPVTGRAQRGRRGR
jgi:iron complex transport system ATP-binding protein